MSAVCDGGFENIDAAKACVRRMLLRRKSKLVRSRAADLLNMLDQRPELHAGADTAVGDAAVSLASSNADGGVRGLGIEIGEGRHMREKELLEGMDLVLQLLDTIAGSFSHGFFSVSDAEDATQRLDRGQPISGAAK